MRPLLLAAPMLIVTAAAAAQIVPRRPEAPAPPPPENQVPDCVTVRAESRQDGVGFTHVVIVQNRCPTTIRCQVATDADPAPTHAAVVTSGATSEIVTRMGSPVPGVRPRVVCR